VKADLRHLYQEIIIDHNRNPRNFRRLCGDCQQARGFNPLCGDEIDLYLKIEHDIIKDISFEGKGCAISTASASLLTEALRGKTITEAQQFFKDVHAMLTTGEMSDNLGKLAVLGGVVEFPARVKCASLAWHTFEAALQNTAVPACTEA
jgi:nitrogen fixation NifU-like protein